MNGSKAFIGYACAVAATAASTLVGLAMVPRFDIVNVAMVYLIPVVLVALRFGRGPTVATSLLAVVVFDLVFVPPQGELRVDDLQYLLTFATMAAIGWIVSSLRDSVRKEERARAMLAAAAETERIRSTLLASIAHDLRTPLSVLTGASSALAERVEQLEPSQRIALARSVYSRSRDLSEQLNKMLELTRLESGAIRPACDWVSIAETADSVLRRNHEQLDGRHVVVEIPGSAPLVRADPVLLEHALGNLVDNAARHTPPETTIRVRAIVHGGEIVVSVEDDAHRLRDDAVDRAFLRFNRGGAENTAQRGLGLSICRAIVVMHGGRCWGEYVPNGGVAFRFALPLDASPPPVPLEPEAA